jgi:hypothetical protein
MDFDVHGKLLLVEGGRGNRTQQRPRGKECASGWCLMAHRRQTNTLGKI